MTAIVALSAKAPASGLNDCLDDTLPPGARVKNCTQLIDARAATGHQLATLLHERGIAYLLQRYFDLATADFDAAIRLDAAYSEAFADRGNVSFQKGDIARALADFDEAVRLDANNAMALFYRALAHRERGEPELALNDYGSAIAAAPRNAEFRIARAQLYEDRNDAKNAIADFDAAVGLDPRNVLAICGRGRMFEKISVANAKADYNICLSLRATDDIERDAQKQARAAMTAIILKGK